jgi:serine/threonine protein kinase
MTFASICEGWEGRTVDGKFPLLEWLGGSADRGVFLTVRQGIQTATIKLILAEGSDADAYLAQWEAAKALFYPSLAPVLESGRCEVDGKSLVYVVTERAEAALSGIIPRKTLDPDKVRVIANRVADALSYVHDKGLVHGSVKPSNILLASDEWKLSGDCVHAAAEAAERVQETGLYDAPEVAEGRVTPASDVWSLGVIVAEALTQLAPIRDGSGKGDPVVPGSLPQPFREVVRGCLRSHPAERYKVEQILALLAVTSEPVLEAAKRDVLEPEPVESHTPVFTPPRQRRGLGSLEQTSAPTYPFGKVEPLEPPPPMSELFAGLEEEEESRMRVAPILFGVLLLLAIAAAFMLRGGKWKQFIPIQSAPAASQSAPQAQAPSAPGESPRVPSTGGAAEQPQIPAGAQDQSQSGTPTSQASQSQPPAENASASSQVQSPPTASSAGEPKKGPEESKTAPEPESTATVSREANTKGAVVERVLPNVSSGASSSMRGPVQVELRVSVNENGTVSNAEYMSHGPGNYFARISHDAARSWKFRPPKKDGQPKPSVWTLRFHFQRGKTEATAVEVR